MRFFSMCKEFGAVLSFLGAAMCLLEMPARAADAVRVHMPPASMESMPYLIADALGFYKDNNIQFEPKFLNTDIGVMAVIAGEIDVTQILGLSLRGAIEKGFDLKIAMIF